MAQDIWKSVEKKICKTITVALFFLILALAMGVLPFSGILQPETQSTGAWWQRAGAPMAVFAFLAQNKAQSLAGLLTPGSQSSEEMLNLIKKYKITHKIIQYAASALTVAGTLIWGYGDLLIK